MSEKIKPALTPEEWQEYSGRSPDGEYPNSGSGGYLRGSLVFVWIRDGISIDSSTGYDVERGTVPPELLPMIIALANASLPHGDDRKITRTWVNWLREEADVLKRNGAGAGALMATEIADALESYLPPQADT
jgi:hypothetical protein